MKKLVSALIVGLCIVTMAAPVAAKTETVTGVVVDLLCYDPQTKENAGMDHMVGRGAGRECAYSCAKWWGQPVGILTADGKLYQLEGGLVADNNAKIAAHVTHTVTITGDVVDKDGIMHLTSNDLTMVKK